MLSAREVGLVAKREVLRNLRSAKGIAMFALFFLGGLLPALIGLAAGFLTADLPPAMTEGTHKQLAAALGGSDVVDHIARAPVLVFWLFQGTLKFLPFLVLLVGFDQIAGEIQYRTIRYSAGRATRPSIVAGKAVGIWAVAAVMVTVLHVTVWVIAIARGGPAGAILGWGLRFLVLSIFSAFAYVGFSTLISSFFRTPIVALFAGAGAGFGLWLVYTILAAVQAYDAAVKRAGEGASPIPAGIEKAVEAVAWLFPNRYDALLIRPDMAHVLGGVALFLVWGAVCVAGASAIVQRRDI